MVNALGWGRFKIMLDSIAGDHCCQILMKLKKIVIRMDGKIV
jgi:hypothetical protein